MEAYSCHKFTTYISPSYELCMYNLYIYELQQNTRRGLCTREPGLRPPSILLLTVPRRCFGVYCGLF